MSFEFTREDEIESLEERVKNHFPTFAQNRWVEFTALEQAVESKDFGFIRDYCHKQLGVASCYHCHRLDELCRYIQDCARSENLIEIKQVMPILSNYLNSLTLKFK